jgi:hypothetical protein
MRVSFRALRVRQTRCSSREKPSNTLPLVMCRKIGSADRPRKPSCTTIPSSIPNASHLRQGATFGLADGTRPCLRPQVRPRSAAAMRGRTWFRLLPPMTMRVVTAIMAAHRAAKLFWVAHRDAGAAGLCVPRGAPAAPSLDAWLVLLTSSRSPPVCASLSLSYLSLVVVV